MREAYSPANAAEAHMLVHLLEQAGIQARIHGEALQGAVGDLPVSNFLQIMVSDEDYDRARKVLLEWEQTNAPPELAPEAPTRKRRFPWTVAIACLVVGALVGWGAKRIVETSRISWAENQESIDLNGDGRPDRVYTYGPTASSAYKGEFDNDFDGRPDAIVYYDPIGTPQSQESDEDFDGVFETRYSYGNGVLQRAEIDTDANRVPDVTITFRHGIWRREEIVDPRYGTVAVVNHYDAGRLVRAEVDLDRDGFLETLRTVDRFGEVTKTETRRPN
jgi:hypothetical protein